MPLKFVDNLVSNELHLHLHKRCTDIPGLLIPYRDGDTTERVKQNEETYMFHIVIVNTLVEKTKMSIHA